MDSKCGLTYEFSFFLSPDAIDYRFPYIEMPLDYILPELLKNACRATVESHHGLQSSALPPVNVVIANNDIDFVIKYASLGS